MAPGRQSLQRAESALRDFALTMPESYEEFPWGDCAIKVRGKVFVFMGGDGDTFGLSTKLPVSQAAALSMSFTKPTGYGLGKAGWVSASFAAKDEPPLALLQGWIEESYRAIAPKALLKTLESAPPPRPKPKKKLAKKKQSKKKA